MKRIVISSAVLALAISGVGVASAEKKAEGEGNNGGFKVTGGGQIIADAEAGGPGDTVGFNAQEVDGDNTATDAPNDAARGQFQYVPRGESADTNDPVTEKFHGVVTCLITGGEADENENNETDPTNEEQLTAGGMARFGGVFRDNPNRFFTVDVTDNGQGSQAEDDLILVRETDQPCADNPENEQANDPEALLRLGRGNVKIHNDPDAATASPASIALAQAKMIKMASI